MNEMPPQVVRPVRADEWPKARRLRLLALTDPAAPIAFLETYEQAATAPDSFWQERTSEAASGARVRQFVAEGQDGTWSGTVTVLIEEAGSGDMFGGTVQQRQAQVVGVFVRPEYRGSGVINALLKTALAWARSVQEVARVCLYVHEDNARAERSYRRSGFVYSGKTVPLKGDCSKLEREMVLDSQRLRPLVP